MPKTFLPFIVIYEPRKLVGKTVRYKCQKRHRHARVVDQAGGYVRIFKMTRHHWMDAKLVQACGAGKPIESKQADALAL